MCTASSRARARSPCSLDRTRSGRVVPTLQNALRGPRRSLGPFESKDHVFNPISCGSWTAPVARDAGQWSTLERTAGDSRFDRPQETLCRAGQVRPAVSHVDQKRSTLRVLGFLSKVDALEGQTTECLRTHGVTSPYAHSFRGFVAKSTVRLGTKMATPDLPGCCCRSSQAIHLLEKLSGKMLPGRGVKQPLRAIPTIGRILVVLLLEATRQLAPDFVI